MKKTKKNLYKIAINFIFILLIILFTEGIIYIYPDKNNRYEKDNYPFLMLNSFANKQKPSMDEYFKSLNSKFYNINFDAEKQKTHISVVKYRDTMGEKFNNTPILLFGCSYGWGVELKDNQTFQYKLSQLLQRPVYNRAITGWGIQHMLYHLKQKDFYKTVPKPEYVIYLYIPDHISRMHKYAYINRYKRHYSFNYLKYNKINNNLAEEKRLLYIPYSRIWNWYILPYFASLAEKNSKISFNMLKLHLLEARYEIDKNWGKDVKFVIFDYETDYNDYNDVLTNNNIKQLKSDRIDVIKTSDLTKINMLDSKYRLKEFHNHPNEAAWDILTPLFADKLKSIKY